MWVIIKHIYVCVCNDVNKGRQRNVEQKKKKEEKEIRWSFLNRALHCNTHKRWDENSREEYNFFFFLKYNIFLFTAIGKPDDGLVCCKYCAASGSPWKKSSPFPPK
jgi:hypothetical protein